MSPPHLPPANPVRELFRFSRSESRSRINSTRLVKLARRQIRITGRTIRLLEQLFPWLPMAACTIKSRFSFVTPSLLSETPALQVGQSCARRLYCPCFAPKPFNRPAICPLANTLPYVPLNSLPCSHGGRWCAYKAQGVAPRSFPSPRGISVGEKDYREGAETLMAIRTLLGRKNLDDPL
jgi:hypothetical protein